MESIEVDPDTLASIHAKAAELGVPLSEVVKLAVDRLLNEGGAGGAAR